MSMQWDIDGQTNAVWTAVDGSIKKFLRPSIADIYYNSGYLNLLADDFGQLTINLVQAWCSENEPMSINFLILARLRLQNAHENWFGTLSNCVYNIYSA